MPRDRETVRRRLQAAALDMYGTTGYDRVTAAEIARRAGVTERTFFRHFADKREVLFEGESSLAALMTEAMRDASADPWAALLHVFQATESFFVENRAMIVSRRRIVAATPSLQERELTKVKMLTLTLRAGLIERGTPLETASLVAHLGTAVFTAALSAWLENGSVSLADRLAATFAETGRLTSNVLTTPRLFPNSISFGEAGGVDAAICGPR